MMARWNGHVNLAKRSDGSRSHFAAAIRKYGKDAFSHEVLQTCETVEEANRAEKDWIEKLDTRNLRFGFNLAPGGQHTPHPIRKNPWEDPAFRAKKKASAPATYAKISAKAAGRPASKKLRDPSPETRARLSEATRTRWAARTDVASKDKAFASMVARLPKYATLKTCATHGDLSKDAVYIGKRLRGNRLTLEFTCMECVKAVRKSCFVAKKDVLVKRNKEWREANVVHRRLYMRSWRTKRTVHDEVRPVVPRRS
jgi:hypothetical protein